MPLFEFENVTVLRGGREVLRRVSFTVGEGEHVAIVGPNDLSALLRSRSNALEIVLSGFFSSATLEPFHDLSPADRARGLHPSDFFVVRRDAGKRSAVRTGHRAAKGEISSLVLSILT